MSYLSDPLLGRKIDGYLIEKPLGAGGMARVYLGRDINLDRQVAIKVIQPLARTDPTFTARFVKEAKAIAALQHPNIINIYRFGEFDGLYYMAMQYIDGVDLSWILNDYGKDNELVPTEDVLRIMAQIASALDYAHGRGVIHRDIKPANIMLDQTGKAYLMDFGLALKQVEGTMGEIFGTPHYMAPEQAMSSAKVVPQSDQYALAVILYEMLTGTIPYDGTTSVEIAMAHVTSPLPSPLERNPDLSLPLVRVLEHALEKEPEKRYPSCAALVADLENAFNTLSGKSSRVSQMHIPAQVAAFQQAKPASDLPPIPLPPISTTRQPRKPAAQVKATAPTPPPASTPWRWVGLAAFILLLVGGGAFLALSGSQTPTEPTATAEVVVLVTGVPTETTVPPTNTILPTVEKVAPTLTETPLSAFTVAPIIVASPTSAPVWTLRMIASGDDSFYVINESDASMPVFNLSALTITTEKRQPAPWPSSQLASGQCISYHKGKNSRMPDTTNCTLIGSVSSVGGSERFWKSEFLPLALSYSGGTLSTQTCGSGEVQGTGCVVTVTSQ